MFIYVYKNVRIYTFMHIARAAQFIIFANKIYFLKLLECYQYR